MSKQVVHISDTHGLHDKLIIPDCDLLIHTGDIGGRTTLFELKQFLEWFRKQSANNRIFIAGNHDLCLDKSWINRQKNKGSVEGLLAQQHYNNAMELIAEYKDKYDIIYLKDSSYNYEGIKIYGSPYSPSFHRQNWVFNADRGNEIKKIWSKIPSDVNILMTHTPPYKILDRVEDKYRESQGEDMNVGCQDLLEIIAKRLFDLKLHAFGHIHSQYGTILAPVSNTRNVLFSNGAVLNNDYKILINEPLIITI